jgi:trans-2,3-dihydro-3-hydroxyanthranilate isomerase
MNRRKLILTAGAAVLTRAVVAENADLNKAFPTAVSSEDNDPRRGAAAVDKPGDLQEPGRPGAAGRYAYSIVDVFSRSPFGGNQLAVVPRAAGLSTAGMQKIARELNLSETTFVLPRRDQSSTCQVRIFTPKVEVPFAGHPTVGTACVLVMTGQVGNGSRHKLILQEGIGPVAVEVNKQGDVYNGVMTITPRLEQPGDAPAPGELAAVLSLHREDVKQVFFAGVGVPFCFAQLTSPETVDRAVLDKIAWTKSLARAWSPHVFLFSGDLVDGGSLYARMFAPAFGIEEDPATGAASIALVGAAAANPEYSGERFRLAIKQGVAMGRPSDIDAVAHKAKGNITSVSVGGATSYVASGEIEVPREFLSDS